MAVVTRGTMTSAHRRSLPMFDRHLSRRDRHPRRAAAVGRRLARRAGVAGRRTPFGGFTVGVQSYTFRKFDLEQRAQDDSGARPEVRRVLPQHIPTDSTPEQIKAILKLCREYDVTPIAFGVQRFHQEPRREQEAVRVRQGARRQVPQRRPDAGQLRQPRQAVRRVQDRDRASTRTARSGKGIGTAGTRPRSS